MRKIKTGDRLFYFMTTIILSLFFIAVLYPCIFVLSASFSSSTEVQAGRVYLLPKGFNLRGYEMVFANKQVWIGFANSIFYTVVGTLINLVVTMMGAYVLARKNLPGRNFITVYFAFTMYFGGGMIPGYLLIRNLGMLNTRWSLLLPGALGVYNMLMARSFIQNSIPNELLEASQMDGCSDIKYLLKVVLPLSKAIMAVLVLYYGVGHWNSYFSAMIYIRNDELKPLTVFLRRILEASKIEPEMLMDPEMALKAAELANVMKYALIVVTMVPIMMLYPFVQKYFVKGVTIGSVKG